jgi:hypothetical protein
MSELFGQKGKIELRFGPGPSLHAAGNFREFGEG